MFGVRCLVIVALAAATAASAQNPVGQIFASDAKVKGAVELASGGAKVMSGSYVSAGDATAVLKLDRGGEVLVCPKTSISVSTSQTGRDLMLGLSVGGVETHYTVSASADSIVTPDFRILLAGPGRFDFAVESAKNGDTCIRALPGNTSSLIVSELMGDGTYQVKPAERLVFHDGRVANPDHQTASCGCVTPAAVLKAEATPPPQPAAPAPTKSEAVEKENDSPVHVEVDAPFIYRADEEEASPLVNAIHLHLTSTPLELTALAPPPHEREQNVPIPEMGKTARKAHKPKSTHLLGRLKSFFASIFR